MRATAKTMASYREQITYAQCPGTQFNIKVMESNWFKRKDRNVFDRQIDCFIALQMLKRSANYDLCKKELTSNHE